MNNVLCLTPHFGPPGCTIPTLQVGSVRWVPGLGKLKSTVLDEHSSLWGLCLSLWELVSYALEHQNIILRTNNLIRPLPLRYVPFWNEWDKRFAWTVWDLVSSLYKHSVKQLASFNMDPVPVGGDDVIGLDGLRQLQMFQFQTNTNIFNIIAVN